MSHAEWIPVGERLPEGEDAVMIWPSRCGACVSIGHMEWRDLPQRLWPWYDKMEDIGDEGTRTIITVTHWMPLPPPPTTALMLEGTYQYASVEAQTK